MKRIYIFLLLFVSLAFCFPPQQFAEIGDLRLQNGQTLYDCKIGFRVIGKANVEKSNIIIFPTWYGGTSEHVSNLVSPDKLIDSTGFMIIVIDALGNGVSTSPSNSERQAGANFPEITIRDMVESQHKLLTEHLEIDNLFGAIGGSMGSMQVFEWLVAYPGFIERALPYVCTPRLSSYDMFRLSFIKELLDSNMSDREKLKLVNMITALTAHSPEHIDQEKERESDFVTPYIPSQEPVFDVNNRRTQLTAMMAHDISRNYEGSMEKAASIITAKMFLIMSKTDHILYPGPALEFARITGSPYLMLENNCGHLAIGCEMQRCAVAVNRFFRE